jgi:uncharacterized protein YijF (DUF1287 family)
MRLKPPSAAPRAMAVARSSMPYSSDDRTALVLLALPFLIVALSLAMSQVMKREGWSVPVIASLPSAPEIAAPVVSAARPAAPPMPEVVLPSALRYPDAPPAVVVAALQQPVVPPRPIELPGATPVWPPQAPVVEAAPAVPPAVDVALPGAMPAYPGQAPLVEVALAPVVVPPVEIALPSALPSWPLPLPEVAPAGPSLEELQRLAAWQPPALPWRLDPSPPVIEQAPAVPAPVIGLGQCTPTPGREVTMNKRSVTPVAFSPMPAADFGQRLANAARAQTEDMVVYTARYQRMASTMGDLPSLYGACSDLVIRAYRMVGLDLQSLVQKARVGSGDANIDHRRTETLRAFFARHGEVIAPSRFPEAYKPGDIVTYYRPFSRVSRAHIAIVSDVIAPSGRPMIIHNRGWGPQLEDALFVDRITGHYRYWGQSQPASPVAVAATPAAPPAAPSLLNVALTKSPAVAAARSAPPAAKPATVTPGLPRIAAPATKPKAPAQLTR